MLTDGVAMGRRRLWVRSLMAALFFFLFKLNWPTGMKDALVHLGCYQHKLS